MHCHLRAVPFCVAFVPLQLFPFLMSGMVRSDTSAATLRQEVPGMACAVWTAGCRVAVRGAQDGVVPQQGHAPWLQQAKGCEARRVHQRVVTDSCATAGQRIFRRYCSPCEQAERSSRGSCIAQAAADTLVESESAVFYRSVVFTVWDLPTRQLEGNQYGKAILPVHQVPVRKCRL